MLQWKTNSFLAIETSLQNNVVVAVCQKKSKLIMKQLKNICSFGFSRYKVCRIINTKKNITNYHYLINISLNDYINHCLKVLILP